MAALPSPTVVHVTLGPSVCTRTGPAGERFCFACRRRGPHTWRQLDDPPERQPSYYDRHWTCRCESCGECATRFPGTEDGPVPVPVDIMDLTAPTGRDPYREALAQPAR